MPNPNHHLFMNIPSPTHHTSPSVNALVAEVKKTLRRRFAHEFGDSVSPAIIRRALDEAELLARREGFPHLLFPLLAEESVRRVAGVLREPVGATAQRLEPVAA